MPSFSWKKFLKHWSDAIIASGEYSSLLDATAAYEHWAGFPPASEAEIVHAEQRLKLRLPDSYRSFLQVSNGWWLDGTDGPVRLLRVDEITRMAEADPEAVSIWSAANPGSTPNEKSAGLVGSDYAAVIQISEDKDGRYLLNPLVTAYDNEWQAAFFADWVPGAECYDSFEILMKAKFDAFIAAHPSKPKRQLIIRDMAKPPKERIQDPQQFLDELQRSGFFDLCSEQVYRAMVHDFLEVYQKFHANNCRELAGLFASPGSVLFDPKSGRVVDLEVSRLAKERGLYAIAAVRPLLASFGIEFGPAEEQISVNSYGVTIQGVSHRYFPLRNGHPALTGGQHEVNEASYVLHETCKILNKALAQIQNPRRLATLVEQQKIRGVLRARPAFVLLDDELSYLMMWSPIIHNYCRPVRPDVL